MANEALEAEAPIAKLGAPIQLGQVSAYGVSDETKQQLDADLDPARVKQVRGKDYLAVHDVIRTANSIFGYGRWGYEVVSLEPLGQCVKHSTEGKPGVYVGYRCIVRLTVDGCLSVSGVGYGDGVEYQEQSPVTAHELAVKEAESDALKRAFRNFGDQFGLILYAKADEKKRIAAEKEAEAYNAPVDVAMLQQLTALATKKGKQVETAQLVEKEQSERGHVRAGRVAAITAKLEALPDFDPNAATVDADALAARGEEQAKQQEQPAAEKPQQFAIQPPDRPATQDEVASLISLAAMESPEKAATVTAAIEEHRSKIVGGGVSYAWLVKAGKKLGGAQQPAAEPSQFQPPAAATAVASDAEVESAFNEQAKAA